MKTSRIQSYSIVCVKAGNKYSNEDVNRLYRMVKGNCSLPFSFYCITDDPSNSNDEIITIHADPKYEKVWAKMLLFSDLLPKNIPTLYLDLDVVVQKNIDGILDWISQADDKLFIIDYDKLLLESWDTTNLPRSSINSSLIGYISGKHSDMFEHFDRDLDYYILKYQGMDRYLTHHHYSNTATFNVKDFYFRTKILDSREDIVHEIKIPKKGIYVFHDPDKIFCVCNGSEEYSNFSDWIYRGLEKYFL